MSNVVIIGGHGQVALRLTRLLTQNSYTVTSVIRNPAHAPDITAVSATPHVLSIEDAPIAALTALFTGKQLVYFAAGAGGKGAPDRTRAVDYKGAVKVFEAIKRVQGDAKPRLILVSAIDTRNPDTLEEFPAHYDEDDKRLSRQAHDVMATYYKWKFEADKNLVERTGFQWTILRPAGLSDDPGTGLVEVGRTHIKHFIPRDDVAMVLFHLASRPDAHGLALDLVSGNTPAAEALDLAIKRGETDYLD